MPLSVLVTVDTESYVKGNPDIQIWGRRGDGGDTGIGAIMDILERHDVRGTFYVNVYEAGRHGDESLQEVIRTIHARGHEVALHSHPHHRFGLFKLCRADQAKQREILAWGKSFIEAVTGKPVLAHRAGAFAANRDTIRALGDIGIPVDASLSPAWADSWLAREVESGNQPLQIDGTLELPVTYFVQGRLGTRRFLRMVDIEACSLAELKHVADQAAAAGIHAMSLLMHSHGFALEPRAAARLPDRLDRFLTYLTSRSDITVQTTQQFFDRWQNEGLAAQQRKPFLPHTGWWLTYRRILALFGRDWRNSLAAAAPVALGALIASAMFRSIRQWVV